MPFAVSSDFLRLAKLETEGTEVVVRWHGANLVSLGLSKAKAKADLERLRAPKDDDAQYSL